MLPTDLALKMQPLLTKISESGFNLSSASSVSELQLSRYVPALKELGTLRLLQQVSQVYQTMKIQYLSSIIPFYDFSTVEKICLDAVKHRFIAIPMKIDHMEGVVSFGNSDSVPDYCSSVLAESLNKATDMIYPPPKRAPELSKVLPCSAETLDEDRRIFLAMKSVIEKMKVEKERRLLEREELKRFALKKIAQAEQKRIASENQRILKEMAERKLQEAQALQKLFSEEVKVATKLTPMDKIRQREKKYQKLAKTIDHLERAKREESAPLIEAAYQKSCCQQGLLEVKECHKREQQIKIQLTIFKDKVMDHKRADFGRRKAEWKEQIAPIIEAKKKKREAIRKKLYYLRREEERLVKKLHEEEAKKQKQLVEKQSLRTPAEPSEQPRPIEPAVAPSTGKYVVKHQTTEDRPSQTSNDTWWCSDDRRPSSFGWSRSSSSAWSSTRRRF